MSGLRPPVVTDLERAWAIALRPAWIPATSPREALGSPEASSEGEDADGDVAAAPGPQKRPQRVDWEGFVASQVESFERFFAFDRRTAGDWARLWRSWFKKSDPRKLFPKQAPRVAHPFCRVGSAEFARALAVATPAERLVFRRIGVAQFCPDDPRVGTVFVASASSPTKPKAEANAA